MAKLSEKAAGALLDRALGAGKIEKSGNWFSLEGVRLGNGKAATIAFLVENASIAERIEALLLPNIATGPQGGIENKTSSDAAITSTAPVTGERPKESVTFASSLPEGIPSEQLKGASIVVASKSERGRRRAGLAFTREETVIAVADLTEEQIDALRGDPELIVNTRFTAPD